MYKDKEMNPFLLPKGFDKDKLKRALKDIDEATKSLSLGEIEDLWGMGYIPSGVKYYLIAIRASV